MRIVITGGAGMVGSHAAEYWAKRGHRVVVLDNLMRSQLFQSNRESVEYNWRYLHQIAGIRLVKGDVRSAADLESVIGGGVDVVLHAAGQPGVGYSIQQPLEDFSINAHGTLQLLEAVRKHSPKAIVLYCSTNKVYGTNVDRIPIVIQPTRYSFAPPVRAISEELSIDQAGHTPYGVSKLLGDLAMQDYAHTYGLRTAVFRMSCIYGTRQFGFEDQGWVAHFTIAAMCGRPITIYGDGRQVRDVLYVEDLIRAFDDFIQSGLPHGVFNVGGGPEQTTSLLELINRLEQLTGRRLPVAFSNWRASDQKVYVSDLSKIQQALKWQPRVAFDEGLRRLVAWVNQNRAFFGATEAHAADSLVYTSA